MAVWSSINMSYGLANKRLDAERYKPQYLKNEKFLSSIKFEYLKKYISDISGGATPKGAKYPNNGIRFVRVQNIRDNFFDLSDVVYIDETVHNGQLFRSQIQESDVLLTITGVSYGNSSTAYKEMLPANINQHSVRIALKSGLLPEVLSTFFCCKYGRLQSDSKVTGDTRPALTYPEIGNYIIPIFDMDNQVEIQRLVKESLQQRLLSHSLYHQAEELLAKELQLDQLKLSNKKWYTTRYCEVNKERRINAEYFSPDVYCILSQDFLKEAVTINDVFEIIRGYTPKCYYRSGVPVVKTKNVRTPNVDKKRISDYADSQEPLTQTKENDLILAAMGVGSLGRMSYVTDKETNCAIDGTLRILRKKDLSLNDIEIPTMLFLSTEVGQKLIYRGISGTTGIISLPDDYLGRIPIPVFEKSVRRKVTELVLNSIIAKNQSEQLLAQAKHRVEELIEQEANKYKQT